ncbi:MAG: hypothetical protein AAGD28_28500 [Bacteroidota bacterium]
MIIRDLIYLAYGLLSKGWRGFNRTLIHIRNRNMKAITREVEMALRSPAYREYLKKKDRNFHRLALGSMFACITLWISLLLGVSFHNFPTKQATTHMNSSQIFAEPIRPRPPLPKHRNSIHEKSNNRIVIWHELSSDVD